MWLFMQVPRHDRDEERAPERGCDLSKVAALHLHKHFISDLLKYLLKQMALAPQGPAQTGPASSQEG